MPTILGQLGYDIMAFYTITGAGDDSDIAGAVRAGYELSKTTHPTIYVADTDDLAGFELAPGGDYSLQTGAFVARAQNHITYRVKCNIHDATATTLVGWLTTDPGNITPTNNAVRVVLKPNVVGANVAFQFEQFITGTWTAIAGTSATYSLPTGTINLDLRIDISGKTARLLKDGTSILGPITLINTPVANSTPGFGLAASGKGSAGIEIDQFCVVVSEDTAAHNLSTSFGVWGNVSVSDVAGGGWSAVGNVSACSAHLWRAIDDAYDDENQANDYILSPSGTTDQLFELNDQAAGTVDAVHIVVMTNDAANRPSAILAKVPGGALTSYSITWGGVASNACIGYAFLQTMPGGGAWTRATGGDNFNSLQVGVRATASGKRVYHMVVQTGGTGLARPTNASACPAAAARGRFACVV